MIKAIIFDFDGVIVNTYENHYATYEKKYKDFDREIHKKLFEGNVHELKASLKVLDESFDISSNLREHLLSENIDKEVKDLLKNLKKKYKLFIITSHREHIINEFLKKEEVLDLFDSVLGFETHKKKDFKFNLLFEKFGLSKEEVIFVTDTLGDIREANKVGVKSIAVD